MSNGEKKNRSSALIRILKDSALLGRFVLLLTVVAIILYLFLYLALPPVIKGIVTASRGSFKFSAGYNGLTIETSGGLVEEITRVMQVPAHRLVNYSDISLTDGEKIEISATGLVDTGNFMNWQIASRRECGIKEAINDMLLHKFDLAEPGDPKNSINRIAKEFLFMQLRREYRFTWRKPDGTLYYPLDDKLLSADPEESYGKIIDSRKAHPDEPYGCLLGYLAYHGPEPLTDEQGPDFPGGILRPQRLFKIGEKNHVEVSDGLVTHGNGKKIPLDPNYGKVFLYFLVNDCIVDRKCLSSLCKMPGERQPSFKMQICLFDQKYLLREQESSLSEEESLRRREGQLAEWQQKMRELWYLDNAGSFTVVINKKKQ